MISILILSSVFLASSWVIGKSNQYIEPEEERRVAIALARQMIDEILTKSISDPHSSHFENDGDCYECDHPDECWYVQRGYCNNLCRLCFDDLDDYDGWDKGYFEPLETPCGRPLDGGNDAFGTPTPDYSMPVASAGFKGMSLYRRQVSVTYVDPISLREIRSNRGFYRITVMVSSLKDFSPDQPGSQVSFNPVVLSTVVSHTYR